MLVDTDPMNMVDEGAAFQISSAIWSVATVKVDCWAKHTAGHSRAR